MWEAGWKISQNTNNTTTLHLAGEGGEDGDEGSGVGGDETGAASGTPFLVRFDTAKG